MLGIASTATALAHGAALRPHRAHIAAVHPKPAATLTAKLDRALNCPTVQYDRVRVTRLEQAYRCGLSKPARGQLLRVYDQAIPVLDATSGTRGLSSPRLPSHDIDRPKAWRRSASQLPASTNQQSSELTWPQKLAWRITLCCPKPVFGTKYVDTSPCYWQAREVLPNSLAPRWPGTHRWLLPISPKVTPPGWQGAGQRAFWPKCWPGYHGRARHHPPGTPSVCGSGRPAQAGG
jgi:hypothetical protein